MIKIKIFGDHVKDNHLMKPDGHPSVRYDALPCTTWKVTKGGTYFLGRILSGLFPNTEVAVVNSGLKPVSVYQIWKSFPASRDEKKKRAFRLDQVVGRSDCHDKPVVTIKKEDIAGSDIIVVDSLGLGWLNGAMHQTEPPIANIAKMFTGSDIVLKLSSLADGIPLLDLPKMDKQFHDKLTVVVSVEALRERGALISRGLSWDRTIEETVREFKSGLSARDLGRCRRVVVQFSLDGVAIFDRDKAKGQLRLNRFVYDPTKSEGSFRAQYEGHMFGQLSLLSAAIVGHLADPVGYPLYTAVCLALKAMRHQLSEGMACEVKEDKPKIPLPESVKREQDNLYLPYVLSGQIKEAEQQGKDNKKLKELKEPFTKILSTFATSFQYDTLSAPPREDGSEYRSRLLADATGYSYEYMAVKAFDIVIKGPSKSLRTAPTAIYGKYRTVDREEIERINAVRNLIVSYRNDPFDKKPLSIAVFGPPGAGKSFAVKQLAKQLGFDDADMIEFNLSQFQADSQTQLHTAFHQVRDASIRGRIPLVFWDEFDAAGYHWLKEFLAPMQDASFTSGSNNHPFGKAIFIFAGGVHHDFQDFQSKAGKTFNSEGKEIADDSKRLKISDFVSRLRGYVNVKGPNPIKTANNPDHEHLIRRAIILRGFLQTALHRGDEDHIPVSAPLAQAFLRVSQYLHGARSMEAMVKMSDTQGRDVFGESSLPPEEQMAMHLDVAEFKKELQRTALNNEMIEIIARGCHQGWKTQKELQGYKLGDNRCDYGPKKTHPLLKPYDELENDDKAGNLDPAIVTLAKFDEAGVEIFLPTTAKREAGISGKELKQVKEKLYRIEHDVWLRDHLLNGYDYCGETDDLLRLHACVQRFDALTEEEQQLDVAIIDAVIEELEKKGYVLKKKGK